MHIDNYKECIKEALRNLIRVNESIFNSLIDISMQGELKEWNETVPIGETHQFDFEIFKNSTDTNIQLLVRLIETVDTTFDTMKNVNGIQLE